jgi:hypothetical protein
MTDALIQNAFLDTMIIECCLATDTKVVRPRSDRDWSSVRVPLGPYPLSKRIGRP